MTYQTGVGPVGDKRRAVVPSGSFLNFGILDNYLGRACNEPHAVKVCVEFYDDPSFAGANVRFGPEAYATDKRRESGFFRRVCGRFLRVPGNGFGGRGWYRP